MCGYGPKFTVSAECINLVADISAMLARIEPSSISRDVRLRKINRVKSIQSSLQIEANSMTVEQVTAIIDGKRVLGPPREILEVQNAIRSYDMIPDLDPFSADDLLKLHGVMMAGLTDQAGMFRSVGVNVVNSATGDVIHHAPHPDFVPRFTGELLEWAASSEHHPLIVSCVFHHEFEFIHPFTDGNGRTGRLWQTLMLTKWNPIFEWISVDSVVRDRRYDYYRAIREATDADDTCVFIEFMLRAIRDTLAETVKTRRGTEEAVLDMIASGAYVSAKDAAERLGVSVKTVERSISMLKEQGRIVREGSDKKGSWLIAEKRCRCKCPCKCPCKSPTSACMERSTPQYKNRIGLHPAMDRKAKGLTISAVAALIVVAAILILVPRGSDEPAVLEAHVTGLDTFGNYALDVTDEQLHDIGADVGYEVYLDVNGERITALHAHKWNGVPHGAVFLNFNPSGEMSLAMYNAYVKEEIKLAVGDAVGISYKGPSKYYDSLDRYLKPYSDDGDDYDNAETYANFRELAGGSLKDDLIYRSASPWTTGTDRTYYVNQLCGEAGIEYLVLLDIAQEAVAEKAEPYKDLYCYGLLESGRVQARSFHPAVLSDTEDIGEFFELMDGIDGSVCISCKLGKDRTGTYCAMLQALAGASYEEVCDEFMVSITNYYGIEKGTAEYEAVEDMYIRPLLYSFQHPEIIGNYHKVDWDSIEFEPFDLHDVVYGFLTSYAGIDSGLIDRVTEKITARERLAAMRHGGQGRSHLQENRQPGTTEGHR